MKFRFGLTLLIGGIADALIGFFHDPRVTWLIVIGVIAAIVGLLLMGVDIDFLDFID